MARSAAALLQGFERFDRDVSFAGVVFNRIGSPRHLDYLREALFEQFYTQVGVPYKGSDFTGRSDYGPFIFFGIPAGGLFTGAEGIKTPDEAAIWGGVAGEQYDPCYHLACDTFDNINLAVLELNANAVAFATLQYAMNTETINGIRGKGNYKLKDLLEEEVME